MPSRSGSPRSSVTRSGRIAATSSRPSRPLSAVCTSRPFLPRLAAMSSRMSGSSSTTTAVWGGVLMRAIFADVRVACLCSRRGAHAAAAAHLPESCGSLPVALRRGRETGPMTTRRPRQHASCVAGLPSRPCWPCSSPSCRAPPSRSSAAPSGATVTVGTASLGAPSTATLTKSCPFIIFAGTPQGHLPRRRRSPRATPSPSTRRAARPRARRSPRAAPERRSRSAAPGRTA